MRVVKLSLNLVASVLAALEPFRPPPPPPPFSLELAVGGAGAKREATYKGKPT